MSCLMYLVRLCDGAYGPCVAMGGGRDRELHHVTCMPFEMLDFSRRTKRENESPSRFDRETYRIRFLPHGGIPRRCSRSAAVRYT